MIAEVLDLEYVRGAELPNGEIAWYDNDDQPIDFSSGHSFEIKVGEPGEAALLTKSGGMTGTVTGITVSWAADELDDLPTGVLTGQAHARHSATNKDYVRQFRLKIIESIL